MMKVLYVVSRPSRFTDIDREALAERHALTELVGRPSPRAALAAARADAVVVWFAGWHAFIPITVAWLLRKPSLVITGGYDVAATDDGYGMQHGGIRRLVARWSLRRATRLMANSESGAREARRAAGERAKIDVVHHGIPDLVGARPAGERAGALTVGAIDGPNLIRKGLLPFVEAAAQLPDEPFVLVGKAFEEAAERRLREAAGANVEFTGFVDDDELARRYASAAVYVQASTHEGFGMAVAEAMLAGCIPVVTPVGALPEVVGETGVVVQGDDVAGAIRRALELGDDARAATRARVLDRFTLERRGNGVRTSLDAAVSSRGRPKPE
jgi:glycosyltransferase involved in cell wall biosynthesis